MTENLHQPRNYDAVLGSQVPVPVSGVVLGGLEGVKRRMCSEVVDQRVAALKDALKYNHSGLDLVIQALKDESDLVQRVAYLLLRERIDPEVRQALNELRRSPSVQMVRL